MYSGEDCSGGYWDHSEDIGGCTEVFNGSDACKGAHGVGDHAHRLELELVVVGVEEDLDLRRIHVVVLEESLDCE